MTAYEDSQLAARFAALAPEPLAADWDDVLHRAGAAREDRQPLWRPRAGESHRRRFLVVLAAAILVVVVGTAAAFGIRTFILERGFIGLPPEGATPSSPETGELVLSAYGPGDGSRTHIWVYADGRVISQRQFDRPGDALPEGANELSSGFLEQRLTIEGVERMRAEAISTGLFAHDSVLSVREAPCFNLIEVIRGDRRVRLTWHGSQCPPLPGDAAAMTATKDEESQLLHLAGRLTNPTWLPASAWQERESRAYVPSRFAIDFGARPYTLEPSRILALLPDSAEELLAAKPRTRLRHFYGGTGVPLRRVYDYRSQVTVDEARTLADALDRAGLERKPIEVQAYSLTYVSGEVPTEGPGDFFFVAFEPVLPHGESVCSACG
jgi:hypothetical protein